MNDATRPVVVGYDGSTEAAAAVDWAAAAASRLGQKLIVVHAATSMQAIVSLGRSREGGGGPDQSSRATAEEGADRVRRGASGVTVEAVTDQRGASSALAQMSENASLLVVGNRGRGRIAGALLGSVAFAVATHAHCPTVVVRGDGTQPPGPSRPVVVGADGSSNTVLDHAADVAADADAQLRVLIAWQSAPAEPWNPADLVNVNAGQEAATEAHQSATSLAQEAAERASTPRPDLAAAEPLVLEGRPDELLAEASTDAGLVVVGARGRGDLARLLLGSVSRAVIHRANCPVAIIR